MKPMTLEGYLAQKRAEKTKAGAVNTATQGNLALALNDSHITESSLDRLFLTSLSQDIFKLIRKGDKRTKTIENDNILVKNISLDTPTTSFEVVLKGKGEQIYFEKNQLDNGGYTYVRVLIAGKEFQGRIFSNEITYIDPETGENYPVEEFSKNLYKVKDWLENLFGKLNKK